MVRFKIFLLVLILAACGAACGMDAELDLLEIPAGKAEQASLTAVPIVLNATYEDVLMPEQPSIFSLILHDGDQISVVLESQDDTPPVWPELYKESIDPGNFVNMANYIDESFGAVDDSWVPIYQIMHPWGTSFRKKYYVKIKNVGNKGMSKYKMRIFCNSGPCEGDLAGDLLTDRFEPNDIRYLSRLSLGIETNLLNLDSGSDVDWMKIPVYKYTTPFITAMAVGPDREPVPGIQVSAWFECTRGFNFSKCNLFPEEEAHTSFVYPELGQVQGCHGNHEVSIKRECLNDHGRNGQLFVRVKWDKTDGQPLTYYKVLIQ